MYSVCLSVHTGIAHLQEFIERSEENVEYLETIFTGSYDFPYKC